jgi:Co/Zn/Cd efflux system component
LSDSKRAIASEGLTTRREVVERVEAGHDHGVTAAGAHRKRLGVVLAITGAVFVAEVIGGLISGSLALLATPDTC